MAARLYHGKRVQLWDGSMLWELWWEKEGEGKGEVEGEGEGGEVRLCGSGVRSAECRDRGLG